MALPVSIGHVIAVTSLAWKTIQGARKACGEYDDLTREIENNYSVLRRLNRELDDPDSLLNKADQESKKELGTVVDECQGVLRILDRILVKYNALSDKERSGRKLWQRVRFGNGKVGDVQEQRTKLNYYTSTLTFHVNMATLGSQGRVEKQMKEAGGDLKDIQEGVNKITAELLSKKGHEGSVMSSYNDDEKAFWRELRRRLVKDGYTNSKIKNHMGLIQAYVEELVERGKFDENTEEAQAESEASRLEDEKRRLAKEKAEGLRSEKRSKTRHRNFQTPEYSGAHSSDWVKEDESGSKSDIILKADGNEGGFSEGEEQSSRSEQNRQDGREDRTDSSFHYPQPYVEPRDSEEVLSCFCHKCRELERLKSLSPTPSYTIAYYSIASDLKVVEVTLILRLEELFYGVTKIISIPRTYVNVTDSWTLLRKHTVQVSIPAGQKPVDKIEFKSVGHELRSGTGERQDIHFVVVEVCYSISTHWSTSPYSTLLSKGSFRRLIRHSNVLTVTISKPFCWLHARSWPSRAHERYRPLTVP